MTFCGHRHAVTLSNAINCNIQAVCREIPQALAKKTTFTGCLDHISPAMKSY